MNVFEINKYRPSLMRRGRYLREDWGACTDIGKTYNDRVVTKAEYLAMEAKYVDAVVRLIDWFAATAVTARGVEHWDTHSDTLTRLQLDDVLATPIDRPAHGAVLPPAAIPNILRRCLRDVAWLEFVAARELCLCVSWDYRLLVATRREPSSVFPHVQASGLYVYADATPTASMTEWIQGQP